MEIELEDIEVLMEALEALEEKAISDGLTSGLLGILMLSGDRQGAEKMLDREMSEAKRKDSETKERVVLTKAKLVQMKRKLIANEAAEYLRKGQ